MLNTTKSRAIQITAAQEKFTAEEAASHAQNLYGGYDYVTYFQAVHMDEESGEFPVDCDPSWYFSWYVPANWEGVMPSPGMIVEVENCDSTAKVMVMSHTKTMSKDQHMDELHPYCSLIRIVE